MPSHSHENRIEKKDDDDDGDVVLLRPCSFQWDKHYYPDVIRSTLCKKVQDFLQLNNEDIVKRYCELYEQTDAKELLTLLQSSPQHFCWSGGDLFHVTDRLDDENKEKMVLIEVNSCPSGQKSMPSRNHDGYHEMMRRMFKPRIASHNAQGALAVLYDKNIMETRAYAAALADVMSENVFYVKLDVRAVPSTYFKFVDRQLFVKDQFDEWHPIRAAFRYVTQKPWSRIPINTRTLIVNPIIACLAGGRNKLLASHAYHQFNERYAKYDIEIRMPETIINVQKEEIPRCVKKLGGMGVIKVPYLNGGQGIYTIVNERELEKFMSSVSASSYQGYIVQSLVGHSAWHTNAAHRYDHVFTRTNEKNEGFVKDLRMQICSSTDGFRPTSIYSRRAREVLSPDSEGIVDSWQMLGTNLTVDRGSDTSTSDPSRWTTESERLVVMNENEDSGLSMDNLVDAYVQTVLGTLAIDQLAQQLLDENGTFNMNLFQSIDTDDKLIQEFLF